VRLYTIGFTSKSAKDFFTSLQKAGVRRVIDVRLRNESQLAGFTKKRDLEYFLTTCHQMGYIHEPILAPTEEMLTSYRKKRMSWSEYEAKFNGLLRQRDIAASLDLSLFEDACLLCSETKPEKCHRRLVADHLRQLIVGLEVVHL
jgi:uncharacterized protein (DUF488 family)